MMRKIVILVMFCSLILPVQQALSATTVEFVDGGGPGVFTFSFDAAWSSPWTFTLDDPATGAVPANWINTVSFGRVVTSANLDTIPTNEISFTTAIGGALSTGTIGSFTIDMDSLSNFKLFGSDTFEIASADSYNPTTDTYTVSNVPIPGSILLLGSGLVGLVGLARRRRSR